jgi:hypothetical protein
MTRLALLLSLVALPKPSLAQDVVANSITCTFTSIATPYGATSTDCNGNDIAGDITFCIPSIIRQLSISESRVPCKSKQVPNADCENLCRVEH